MDLEQASATLTSVSDAVSEVVRDSHRTIRLTVATIAADGHVLLEDPPGSGKTTLAHAIASALGLSFSRIQGTPDLMPGDVTGNVLPGPDHRMVFHPGPVFAQLVLADELNRTPPRTQAALLETMSERQVTVDGVPHPLPRPHHVIATQNPTESHGTFPLPDSQLDRFMVRLSVGHPEQREEMALVRMNLDGDLFHAVQPMVDADQLAAIQARVRTVAIPKLVLEYLTSITRATREHPDAVQGASPRGSVHLAQLCQAWAVLQGRDVVLPEDVKDLAPSVLTHRIVTSGGRASAIVADALERTVAPR